MSVWMALPLKHPQRGTYLLKKQAVMVGYDKKILYPTQIQMSVWTTASTYIMSKP